MQHGRKTNMNTRQPRPAWLRAGRSQRRASSGPRPELRDSHNARRNYDRYLALAQAEFQAGDKVAAENYYQHAELVHLATRHQPPSPRGMERDCGLVRRGPAMEPPRQKGCSKQLSTAGGA